MAKLTCNERQKSFATGLATHGNGAKAVREAGYSNQSPKSYAARLLLKSHVKAFYEQEKLRLATERDAKLKTASDQQDYNEGRVRKELAAIGFARITDVCDFDEDGVRLKPSCDLDESTLAAISEITETAGLAGRSVKIKLHPKIPALQTMAKDLGMLIERHEITEKKAKVYMEMVARILVEKGVDPEILSELAAEMEEMEND